MTKAEKIEWTETDLAAPCDLARVVAMYCDGGVIGRNPSPYGGTWAYLFIDGDEQVIEARSGVHHAPAGGPEITNNISELDAMCHGLTRLPEHWEGMVFCDSQVTLARLFGRGTYRTSWNGVHEDQVEWARNCRARLGLEITTTLLAGHPTRADLENGYKIKKENLNRKWPVSRFNVMCDIACNHRADQYRAVNGMAAMTEKTRDALRLARIIGATEFSVVAASTTRKTRTAEVVAV